MLLSLMMLLLDGDSSPVENWGPELSKWGIGLGIGLIILLLVIVLVVAAAVAILVVVIVNNRKKTVLALQAAQSAQQASQPVQSASLPEATGGQNKE